MIPPYNENQIPSLISEFEKLDANLPILENKNSSLDHGKLLNRSTIAECIYPTCTKLFLQKKQTRLASLPAHPQR